jgi:hypothetical protein
VLTGASALWVWSVASGAGASCPLLRRAAALVRLFRVFIDVAFLTLTDHTV